ncbi:MAG TPA: response regulator transcription factor [Solirubrobacteraceae bacterium]|nr:response regulator transcription factor [Solirubrobacteraceae bacterium]
MVAADDAYVIREFLASALGSDPHIELAAICADANQLESEIASRNPDVIVTDVRMPPSGADEGIRLAGRLRESHPEMGVVVLSQYADPEYAVELLADGTGRRAYLLKERIRHREELIAAVEAVAAGGSVVDPLIVDLLIEERMRSAQSRLTALTQREREILAEIATGKSNGAIAASLFLTKRAVEKHVNSIFSKLDLPMAQDVSPRVKATLIYLADEGVDARA